jgi:hypothetical protein
VVLTGWSLKFRAANNNNGGADTDLATLSGSIPAGGYQLYAGSAYPGTKDGDLLSALAGLGGAVGLRDASNALVDSVAYANLTVANPFTETAPAPNPPAGESIARKPNGSDTGNNSTDFQVVTLPTPRAAN